ncbi:S8 family serine peptidase [Burkholderia sp. 4701]|nr:S8 family serine peptidase [Burkholderia sp. 4701]MXN83615.1 S8 family serine peptidase [Burkholderia sp. 4812]
MQSDFAVGVIVVQPQSEADLKGFLSRFGGRVLWTDGVPPEVLRALGAPRDARPVSPKQYGVQVDLARAALTNLPARMSAAGLRQTLAFSSEAGLRTFAVNLAAREAGYAATAEFLAYPHQAFPKAMFKTNEGGSIDGFTVRRYGFSGDGAQANIIGAWQFVAAHGITRRVRVAIIDSGFFLAGDGPQTDTDFPPNPPQWNFEDGGPSAGGPSGMKCTGGAYVCPWHGTGSAGVAAGLINNASGKAGVGGMVGDLMLIKRKSSHYLDAVAAAIQGGADVVSMSFGGGCNYWCRVWGPSASAFNDYVDAGGKAVFVASAGNDGRPVNDDNGWVRPCTLGPVICVGALADGTKSRWQGTSSPGSNYGARVDIFAPQGIPVMSYPNYGTTNPVPQTFGATSSAAPVVSGVVAMMKAINPDLGPLQVRQILRDTAHAGVGAAPRTLDALAAVRAAAVGIPIVQDALGGLPRDFGEIGEAGQENLNLDGAKKQVFKFSTPQASTADVTLVYPDVLGPVEVRSFFDASDACPASIRSSVDDRPPPLAGDPGGTQHIRVYHYRVSGGAHSLVVGANDVNAYDIHLSVKPDKVIPDAYEPNESFATARRLGGFPMATSTVGISATLHTPVTGAPADRDVFIVRGTDDPMFRTAGVGFNVNAFPAIQISNFQSPISLDVYRRNPDGSVGTAVARGLNASACAKDVPVVPLEAGRDYFVVVTGESGSYDLFNGGHYTVERVNYINLEDVLTRPGPVEIGEDTRFVLTPDPAWRALVSDSARTHLQVIDPRTRTVVQEAAREGARERLDLSALPRGQSYFLQAKVLDKGAARTPLQLAPELAPARRISVNLLRDTGGGDDFRARGWTVTAGAPVTTAIPPDDGNHPRRIVLTGGADDYAALRQVAVIPEDWRSAVAAGGVRAQISGQLGGQGGTADYASVRLTFLDARGEPIASRSPPPVMAEDRGGRTALLSVQAAAAAPANATAVEVLVEFQRASGGRNEAYADGISLTLADYGGR